jgi:hypothetical protein
LNCNASDKGVLGSQNCTFKPLKIWLLNVKNKVIPLIILVADASRRLAGIPFLATKSRRHKGGTKNAMGGFKIIEVIKHNLPDL